MMMQRGSWAMAWVSAPAAMLLALAGCSGDSPLVAGCVGEAGCADAAADKGTASQDGGMTSSGGDEADADSEVVDAAASGMDATTMSDSGNLDAATGSDGGTADSGMQVPPFAACTGDGGCSPGDVCRLALGGSGVCAASCQKSADCATPEGTYEATAVCTADKTCRLDCAPLGVPPLPRSCPTGMICRVEFGAGRSCY